MNSDQNQEMRYHAPAIRITVTQPHGIVLIVAGLVFVGSWLWLPSGGKDWRADIGPAARAWWPKPWEEGLPLPPYAALLLSPLGGLSDQAATAVNNALAVVVVGLVILRFGGPAWGIIPVFVSPAGFWIFKNGQTDWLVLLGLLFFNGLDVLLFTVKPQVAAWVVVARIKRAGASWRRYLLPALVLIPMSLVVWLAWPVHLLDYGPLLVPSEWNVSLWPWSIPIGTYLVWRAWRTGDDKYGLVASPLLFPYVNFPSYLGVLVVAVVRWPFVTLAIWALIWILSFAIFFIF